MRISEYGIHATKFMSHVQLYTQTLESPFSVYDSDQTQFFYSSDEPFARLFVDWDYNITLAFTNQSEQDVVTKYVFVVLPIEHSSADIRHPLAKTMIRVVPTINVEHKQGIMQNLEKLLRKL